MKKGKLLAFLAVLSLSLAGCKLGRLSVKEASSTISSIDQPIEESTQNSSGDQPVEESSQNSSGDWPVEESSQKEGHSSQEVIDENPQGLEFRLSDHGTYYVGQGSSASISSVVIPTTYKGIIVDGIFDNGFENSESTSISIPDSVTTIGVWAFSNCSSLESITIPGSVTFIGGYAFSGCTSLSSVIISDGVTYIGD
ncbi:MAG: leucine-rich repeat domain-containing protein, partial [Bacilli bacterium]|nr:leucine-rich repeat domain-containing protein [Bacilli bacterium]